MSKNFELLRQAGKDPTSALKISEKTVQSVQNVRAKHSNGRRVSAATQEMHKLVQRLFLGGNGSSPRSVLFCGIEHGNGASHICLSAAETLAIQGAGSVCLIDGNLRSPSLDKHFKIGAPRGWAEALSGSDPIKDLARKVQVENLWVMPAGSPPPKPYEPLPKNRLEDRLKQLRTHFDYVLIDAPPVKLYSDVFLFARNVDGVVLVLEAHVTRQETVQRIKAGLERAGLPLLGAILNKRTFPIPQGLYEKL